MDWRHVNEPYTSRDRQDPGGVGSRDGGRHGPDTPQLLGAALAQPGARGSNSDIIKMRII